MSALLSALQYFWYSSGHSIISRWMCVSQRFGYVRRKMTPFVPGYLMRRITAHARIAWLFAPPRAPPYPISCESLFSRRSRSSCSLGCNPKSNCSGVLTLILGWRPKSILLPREHDPAGESGIIDERNRTVQWVWRNAGTPRTIDPVRRSGVRVVVIDCPDLTPTVDQYQ